MRVKRYDGSSIKDVMTRVRTELGRDAVILYTRKYRVGGVWGLLGRERVEILAGADIRIASDVSVPREGGTPVAEAPIISPAPAPTYPAPTPSHPAPGLSGGLDDERLRRLEDKISTLTEVVGKLATHAAGETADEPDDAGESYEEAAVAAQAVVRDRLVDSDVSADTAARVIAVSDLARAPGEGFVPFMDADPLDAVARAILVSGEIVVAGDGPKIVALIGPTGVGKTTTIAKLAARLGMLSAHHKVALVTIDTYRIAAVDQLNTYAEIMDVPLQVATDRKTLLRAIERASEADLILIDTAGRSQKNEMHMGELRSCLEGLDAEVHLVLSATSKERDQYDVVERFGAVPIDRYVFSKMDETNSFGFILNLIDRYPRPISYVTTGQRVPDDIEVADSRALARLIVGEPAAPVGTASLL